MPNYVPISVQRHGDKAWQRSSHFLAFAHAAVIPLVGAELARAALNMPIAFVEEAENLRLMAITSLTPGRNLFVAPDGRWLGGYVPAALRAYPFALLAAEPGSSTKMLCIDEDSGLVTDRASAGAESFFDEANKPTATIQSILDFLVQVDTNRASTEHAIKISAQYGLFSPWPLRIQTLDGLKDISGIWKATEEKMNSITGDDFIKLRDCGALPILYYHLVSLGQISIFENLKKIQEQIEISMQNKKNTIDILNQHTDDIQVVFDLSKI